MGDTEHMNAWDGLNVKLEAEAVEGPDAELWARCKELGINISKTQNYYWAWTTDKTPKNPALPWGGLMAKSEKDWQTPARRVLREYLFAEELKDA